MSMRLRRLQADYERLRSRCEKSPYVRIRNTKGNPPERYEIEFSVKGLRLDSKNQIVEADDHLVEIVLTTGYPRQAPQCRMLTSIFHPNIDTATICIGDHWAAAEALDDLVFRIAEMISFQSYNTKSPLNGEAARWADLNQDLLPIDTADLWPAEDEPTEAVSQAAVAETIPPTSRTPQCVNCGATGVGASLLQDVRGRWICGDCLGECPVCLERVVFGEKLCTACQTRATLCIEKVRTAVAQKRIADAKGILKAAQREFSDFQPLREEEEALNAAIGQAKDLANRLNAALKSRRFHTASQLLVQLREAPIVVAGLDKASSLCSEQQSQATSLCKRAEREMKENSGLGAALLKRAKQICDDAPDVEAASARLQEQRESVPEYEERLLAALKKGRATDARLRLADLVRVASVPPNALAQIDQQILTLENARRTVKRLAIGCAFSSALIIAVAAVLIGSRGQ